jgi:hypothetical protein
MNAAHVIDIEERRTAHRGQDGAEIVAVVLSDGSVRDLTKGETDRPEDDFETGQVEGRGWTLWWERRSW